MKTIRRLLMTGLLIIVLGFCVFGFTATYEAMSIAKRWTGRAFYSVAGFSTLAGLVLTWRSHRRKEIA